MANKKFFFLFSILLFLGCSSGGGGGGGGPAPGPSDTQTTPTPTPTTGTPTPTPVGTPIVGPSPTPPPSDPVESVGEFKVDHEMTYAEQNSIFQAGCTKIGQDEPVLAIDPKLKVGDRTYTELVLDEKDSPHAYARFVSVIKWITEDEYSYTDTVRRAENMGFEVGQSATKVCNVTTGKCDGGFQGGGNIKYMFINIFNSQYKYEVGTYTMPDGRKVNAWRKTRTATGRIVTQEGDYKTDGKSLEVTIKSPDLVSHGMDICGGGDILGDITVTDKNGVVWQNFRASRLTDNPL